MPSRSFTAETTFCKNSVEPTTSRQLALMPSRSLRARARARARPRPPPPPVGPAAVPSLAGGGEGQGTPAGRDHLLRLPLQDAYLRQKTVGPAHARLVHRVELPDVPGPRGVVPGPVGHDDARQLLVGRPRQPELPLSHKTPSELG